MRPSVPYAIRSDSQSIAIPTQESAKREGRPVVCIFAGLLVVGVLMRLFVVAAAGNRLNAPWGGGGDTSAYALLAHNLATGKGYGYAGHPTAFRAPAYPIELGALMKIFGGRAFAADRVVQFGMGLLIALLCGAIAGRLCGRKALLPSITVALLCPTLIVMTGEILTETSATLIATLFLYCLVRFVQEHSWVTLACASVLVGIAALVRFNMAAFGIVVLGLVLCQHKIPKWGGVALAILLPAVVTGPWLIRNFLVFHTAPTFSTESGPAAVMGMLTPQGRAMPGDSERLREALGWVPPADLETNDASRNNLGDESDLNRKAWHVAFQLWRQTGWKLIPLETEKLSFFWLSTDQLLWTHSFRPVVRTARAGGVLIYWGLLALGIAGWFRLRKFEPQIARVFLLYAALITILHLPFDMNTRLRMPFTDGLLAVLVGIWSLRFHAIDRGAEVVLAALGGATE
ncbi:MAG TPA: glycosyltransferase family 39 protein [Candidatus Limnocylindrales bacterium]|nr:glycosyltransferase family 39 protein [Candidatus Limnocylindrales bacterium]